jgi:3-oxoacyl-[acyl-carrier protein] reductase
MHNENKTIVITGGSRGIGREICRSFASKNTKIFFNFFSYNKYEEEKKAASETERLVYEIGGSAKGFSVNIAETEEVKNFFQKIINDTGRIDVLVNNAGITKDGLLMRMKDDDWDSVLNINLKGAFLCSKAASKMMMKQRSGKIINIASVSGAAGNSGQSNYSASKAGLIGFTKSIARELAPRNITVNAVAPGFIKTDMTAVLKKEVKDAMIAQIPLKRPGMPSEVAAAVKFLASDAASYITGQVLHVNGGMYM